MQLGVVVVHRSQLLPDQAKQHRGHIQVDTEFSHVPTHANGELVALLVHRQISKVALDHGKTHAHAFRSTLYSLPDDVAQRGLNKIHEVVALGALIEEPRNGPRALHISVHDAQRHDASGIGDDFETLLGLALPLLDDIGSRSTGSPDGTSGIGSEAKYDQLRRLLDPLEIHPDALIEALDVTTQLVARVGQALVHGLQTVVVHRIDDVASVVHNHGLQV
mmetsp:Transcript_75460/g.245461  ORF Transcript_75460/g.245461 Transcript_75460/m.245461 type:complete len:220 (-) Transcript_75460:137-796(-)